MQRRSIGILVFVSIGDSANVQDEPSNQDGSNAAPRSAHFDHAYNAKTYVWVMNVMFVAYSSEGLYRAKISSNMTTRLRMKRALVTR